MRQVKSGSDVKTPAAINDAIQLSSCCDPSLCRTNWLIASRYLESPLLICDLGSAITWEDNMKNSTTSTKNIPSHSLRLTLERMQWAIEVFNGNPHAAYWLFKYFDSKQVDWTSFYHWMSKCNLHLHLDKYRERVAFEDLAAVNLV